VGILAAPHAPATVADSGDGDGTGDGDNGNGDGVTPPLSEDDVTDHDDGGIKVPASAYPGETITIGVGGQHSGKATTTYIYSDATLIGQSIVDADGNIRVTIPADTPTGMHTIAV